MRYLLDTNIFIAAMKGMEKVRDKLTAIPLSDLLLSPVVLGELQLGVEKSQHREKNAARLARLVEEIQLAVQDAETSRHYGEIRAELERIGKPIGAKIIYEELPSGKEVGIAHSNPETGEYEIHLPGGKLYGFRAEADGHISENQNLDLRNYKKDGVIETDIRLAPIEVAAIEENTKIVLNNIFFDFDRFTLKPESFPELNRIVTMMNEKPGMQVELAGHTDPVGSDQYNMVLSERRAKAVGKFLVEKGIVQNRIIITFFGETKLVDKSNTKAGNEKNRRVEFKILKL